MVYLHRPPSNGRNPSAPSGKKSPRLIVLASWMDAREPHIAKYTTRLQALYPDASMVLIRSFGYHFTTRVRLHPKEIEPAVPVIRSIMAEVGGGKEGGGGGEREEEPDMLIHLFSNGGSTTLRYLYGLYAQSARPGEPARLPNHVTIFDSAPGQWQWGRSVTAFTIPLARSSWVVRLVTGSLIHLLCAFYWVMHVPWGRPGHIGRSWLVHNDRAVNKSECRRAYIYSEEDKLVDYRDVEEHAAAAAESGYVSRLEKFRNSPHVAHVRVDEQRYWGIVRSTWENEPGEPRGLVR